METTLQQSIAATYTPVEKTGTWKRFITWCDSQEKYRFGWLGAAIAGHGCIATPITLFAVIMAGNPFIFWILAIVAMGASLITNLAALPTKITLPIFFFSLLIDLIIIIACVSFGFNVDAVLS